MDNLVPLIACGGIATVIVMIIMHVKEEAAKQKRMEAAQKAFEKTLKASPMPECGDKRTHYGWTRLHNMPCPKCMANQERQKLAKEVALELSKLLKP